MTRGSQLIVLGMHRSGTSAVTGLLHQMGAYVGPMDLMAGATPDNPRGLWERRDIYSLNEAVLLSAGFAWHMVAHWDPLHLPEAAWDSFQPDAAEILGQLDANRPWVAKDPRFSLLLPFWRPLLDQPIFVLACRHPTEVALSLKTRNHLHLPAGIALWEKYMLSALQVSAGQPRVLVYHREMLDDPWSFAQSLYRQLVDQGAVDLKPPVREAVCAFIRSDLYHNHEDPRLDRILLHDEQQQLIDRLWSGSPAALARLPPLSARSELILKEYEENHRVTMDMRQRIRDLDRRCQQMEQRLVASQTDLASHVHELEQALEELQQSTSWRMANRTSAWVQSLRGGAPEATPARRLDNTRRRVRSLMNRLGRPDGSSPDAGNHPA
jgi:hypothetical protein